MFSEKLLAIAVVRVNELKTQINELRKKESETLVPAELEYCAAQIRYAKEWLEFNEWIVSQKGIVKFGQPYRANEIPRKPWMHTQLNWGSNG